MIALFASSFLPDEAPNSARPLAPHLKLAANEDGVQCHAHVHGIVPCNMTKLSWCVVGTVHDNSCMGSWHFFHKSGPAQFRQHQSNQGMRAFVTHHYKGEEGDTITTKPARGSGGNFILPADTLFAQKVLRTCVSTHARGTVALQMQCPCPKTQIHDVEQALVYWIDLQP